MTRLSDLTARATAGSISAAERDELCEELSRRDELCMAIRALGARLAADVDAGSHALLPVHEALAREEYAPHLAASARAIDGEFKRWLAERGTTPEPVLLVGVDFQAPGARDMALGTVLRSQGREARILIVGDQGVAGDEFATWFRDRLAERGTPPDSIPVPTREDFLPLLDRRAGMTYGPIKALMQGAGRESTRATCGDNDGAPVVELLRGTGRRGGKSMLHAAAAGAEAQRIGIKVALSRRAREKARRRRRHAQAHRARSRR